MLFLPKIATEGVYAWARNAENENDEDSTSVTVTGTGNQTSLRTNRIGGTVALNMPKSERLSTVRHRAADGTCMNFDILADE